MAEEKEKYRFYPDHVATETVMGLFLLFLITIFSIVFPPSLGEMADPTVTPEHIKPEWYFYPMYFWIRITPKAVGVLVPVLAVIAFVFWPFIDAWLQKIAPGKEIGTIIGIIGAGVMVLFLVLGALI